MKFKKIILLFTATMLVANSTAMAAVGNTQNTTSGNDASKSITTSSENNETEKKISDSKDDEANLEATKVLLPDTPDDIEVKTNPTEVPVTELTPDVTVAPTIAPSATAAPTATPTVPPTKMSVFPADFYIWGNRVFLNSETYLKNGSLLVPIKNYLENLGVYDFRYTENGPVIMTYGEKMIEMNIGSETAFLNGATVTIAAPEVINGNVYAPLRFICEYFGFTVKAEDYYGLLVVRVDDPIPQTPWNAMTEAERYVNSSNLGSDTKYLIWVDKSAYTLYVFLGENGNWDEIYSCKCAIGASATPTITGTFKYFSRESRWPYENFYVGPIMRFYGGYAIHSTLIKYDGTPYNNTVGTKLSHGCVRVRPYDINWLVCYVPVSTTVHITE